MSALLLYLESREEDCLIKLNKRERGSIMEEKVNKILEFIDENRHRCDIGCYGCDHDFEFDGSLGEVEVDELRAMLCNLLVDYRNELITK